MFAEESKPVVGDGKSEKIVPASTEKITTKSAEASKPTATSEILIPDITVVKPVSSSSQIDEYSTQEENSLLLVTIFTKREFQDLGHKESGKHYLPFCPNLTKLGRRSGLLFNWIFMALWNLVEPPINGIT